MVTVGGKGFKIHILNLSYPYLSFEISFRISGPVPLTNADKSSISL